MEIIFMLITVSLAVALLFLGFFLFGIKNGQFDDMHTPSVRILFENKTITETKKENGKPGNIDSDTGKK